jgi:hypothetical protein
MESENRSKSHGKVMENRENLKKTWKSHGRSKIKNVQIKYQVFFRKTACGAFPLIFVDAYFIEIKGQSYCFLRTSAP